MQIQFLDQGLQIQTLSFENTLGGEYWALSYFFLQFSGDFVHLLKGSSYGVRYSSIVRDVPKSLRIPKV